MQVLGICPCNHFLGKLRLGLEVHPCRDMCTFASFLIFTPFPPPVPWWAVPLPARKISSARPASRYATTPSPERLFPFLPHMRGGQKISPTRTKEKGYNPRELSQMLKNEDIIIPACLIKLFLRKTGMLQASKKEVYLCKKARVKKGFLYCS